MVDDQAPASQVTIQVALSADDFFAMPAAATIASMVANLDPDHRLAVSLLDGGIKPANVARIRALASPRVEIDVIQPSSPRLDRLAAEAQTGYPRAAWFRLLLPEILPESVDRVIYLDTDVVVEDGLAGLWELDIGDAWVAGVGCGFPMAEVVHLAPLASEERRAHHYYNTGVLIMDLAAWREHGVLDRVLDFMGEHPEALAFADQDALNLVLSGRWFTLPPRWNQTVAIRNHADGRPGLYPVEDVRRAVEDPAVIHFTEVDKPWRLACDHPDRARFFHYLDQTAWAGWRPTRMNEAGRLARRALRRGRRIASRRVTSRAG